MADTDTLRPFSSVTIISPHVALESLAHEQDQDLDSDKGEGPSSSSAVRDRDARRQAQEHEEEEDDEGEEEDMAADDTDTGRQRMAEGDHGQEALPPRYMVRAQFDFEASDPSALSFHAGDLIEVYTMLESGWWDGMLGERRGWFPSNFVEEVDQDQEYAESDDPHGGSSSVSNSHDQHEHGLVGDEMDRERDMRMLEREDFAPPTRTRNSLGVEDALAGGAGWGAGGGGLEDLAREMMDANLEDEAEQEGKAFEAEALKRRHMRDSGDTGEFGTLVTPQARRREETDDTIRAMRNGRRVAGRGGATDASSTPGRSSGASQDAWIPSLTPDGQVRGFHLRSHAVWPKC